MISCSDSLGVRRVLCVQIDLGERQGGKGRRKWSMNARQAR